MRRLSACTSASVLLACAPVVAGSQSVVRLLDSTRIKETAEQLVGIPNAIIVGPRGNYLISDFKEQHVLQVAPNGSIVRQLGTKGAGPGEFKTPSQMVVIGDTTLLVLDPSQHRFTAFDLRTGKYKFSTPSSGRYPYFFSSGKEVFATNPDPKGTAAVASVSPLGVFSAPQGALPEFAKKNPMLIDAFFIMTGAVRGNDIWAVTELTQGLLHWTKGAHVADEIPIPVVRRKGVSAALYEQMLKDPSSAGSIAYAHSQPFAMSLIAPDIIAFITLDPTLKDQRFRGPHYLTLVDVKLRRACIDTKLPIPEDPMPRLTFSRDTIVVLQQDTEKDDEPATAIRRFAIDVKQCKWIPLK